MYFSRSPREVDVFEVARNKKPVSARRGRDHDSISELTSNTFTTRQILVVVVVNLVPVVLTVHSNPLFLYVFQFSFRRCLDFTACCQLVAGIS